MRTIRLIHEMQALSKRWHQECHSIGLVPTMGFLHEGHLSLVRLARERTDRVVVSIFVNPTQFGPSEDLESYPHDLAGDESRCREAGADIVFHPASEEMYAPDSSTWVTEEQLSAPLCGTSRAGHFRGVTTVVTKLFNVVTPDLAVFGQKDAQQALVIRRMVRDLNVPVEIAVGPTVREPDGLAMSSRNAYLSSEERCQALSIRRGLLEAQSRYAKGERHAGVLLTTVRQEIEEAGGHIDYAELCSRSDLAAVSVVTDPSLLAVAVFFGKARLIDNCFLG